MEQIRSLDSLLEYAKQIAKTKGPKVVAVAKADDKGLLSALEEARAEGIAKFILTGEKAKIEGLAKEMNIDLSAYEIIDCKDEVSMAMEAVSAVSSGRASIYMKGQVHTNHFLRAMLNKEVGLRSGKNTISHCYFHHVKGYDRLFFVSDCAFNMYPDLNQKADILKNTVKLARSFGVECPKVAVLAAVEVVNPDMPATLDAAALTAMNNRGQITNCLVDGPFALDNAVSEESAKTKGITSPVAGKADVLLVPNIDAGNMMAKAIVYFSENDTAGLILGAKAPVVLTSRADSPRAKLLSVAAAVALADFDQK